MTHLFSALTPLPYQAQGASTRMHRSTQTLHKPYGCELQSVVGINLHPRAVGAADDEEPAPGVDGQRTRHHVEAYRAAHGHVVAIHHRQLGNGGAGREDEAAGAVDGHVVRLRTYGDGRGGFSPY